MENWWRPARREPWLKIRCIHIPKHIVVENNRFDDCDHVKCWGQGVIQVDTPVREVEKDHFVLMEGGDAG